MSHHPPVLIAGGGIGGLTLALALAKRGVHCHILESRLKFSELGAGIQLGPNATRILDTLGLLTDLRQRAFSPRAVEIKNGQTEDRLAILPLTPNMQQQFLSPYLTMRRVDLQDLLLEHVQADERITITNGFRLKFCQQAIDEYGVTALSAEGVEIAGAALIGADGIWSQTREIIAPGHPLHFSGKTAWRALVPMDTLSSGITTDGVGLWLGPNAHLVHYPVGPASTPGNQLNIVAIIDEPSEVARWSAPAEAKDLLPHFASWGRTPKQLLQAATSWRKWSLFDAPALTKWHDGAICLIGDAAHPVLPFLAQGGAMAIEDAFVIGESISRHGDDITRAFEEFKAIRKSRCDRVQTTSRKNGTIYHMRRPISLARDFVLKRSSPTGLLRRYDWLYGYHASA